MSLPVVLLLLLSSIMTTPAVGMEGGVRSRCFGSKGWEVNQLGDMGDSRRHCREIIETNYLAVLLQSYANDSLNVTFALQMHDDLTQVYPMQLEILLISPENDSLTLWVNKNESLQMNAGASFGASNTSIVDKNIFQGIRDQNPVDNGGFNVTLCMKSAFTVLGRQLNLTSGLWTLSLKEFYGKNKKEYDTAVKNKVLRFGHEEKRRVPKEPEKTTTVVYLIIGLVVIIVVAAAITYLTLRLTIARASTSTSRRAATLTEVVGSTEAGPDSVAPSA